MAKLIYTTLASVDGYIADKDGNFEWAAPQEDVHAFVNELERPIGTYLYGRRLYETMKVWDDPEAFANEPRVVQDYGAIWRSAEKIVYSSSLASASSARTRIERVFDADAVRGLKEDASSDVSIGGPTLAAHAIRARLVDEFHFFLNPIVIGGGTRALPDDVRVPLELLDEHRFGAGVVHLHYRMAR
jgi:dihydrofolate reductase